MSLQTTCDKCGRKYTLPDDQRGKKVRCKECGYVFMALDGGTSSPDEDPPIEGVSASRSTGTEKTGVSRSSRPRAEREEEPERPARKKRPPRSSDSGDSTLKVLLISGGVLGLLFVGCCGGFGYWLYSKGKEVVEQVAPSSIDAALANLRSENVLAQMTGASYLANTSKDQARQNEVVQELEKKLSSPNDGVRGEVMRALVKWGGRENTPAVLAMLAREPDGPFLSNSQKYAIEAFGAWKDERGVPVLLRYLGSAFGHTDAEKALRQMGSKAEPELLLAMHDANRDVAQRARNLLERDFRTIEDKLLTQTAKDLRSEDFQRQKSAAEWLVSRGSVPQMAERRRDVARSLDTLVLVPDRELQDLAMRALARWATVDNAASLSEIFARGQARNHAETALRQIGAPAEPEVVKLLQDPDPTVKIRTCGLLQQIGTRASLPELQKLEREPNIQVATAARAAGMAIQRRGR